MKSVSYAKIQWRHDTQHNDTSHNDTPEHKNTTLRGVVVEHIGVTWVAQQSVTKVIIMTFINFVIPKAAT